MLWSDPKAVAFSWLLPSTAAEFPGIFRKMKNYGEPEEMQFF